MAQQKKLKSFVIFLKNKKVRILLSVVFLLLISFNVISTIDKEYYSSTYWQRFPTLKQNFLDSQYANKHPKGWIPDEMAFSYSAGELIKGENPVFYVPDAPPTGKYLIGLSILLFNNENVVILLSAILSLILLFFLSKQVFSSNLLALVPSLLFSFESIFKNQLKYMPLLDLFQLVFILAAFIFFNKAINSKKSLIYFLLANVMIGLFISTKFFISGIVIYAAFYLILLLRKDWRKFVELTFTVPVAVFILLFSYVRVFAYGYNFHNFLGIQKWVFNYHKSFIILPFSVWPLLLLNKWYVWYGNNPVIKDSQWIISWPILTISGFVTLIISLIKKVKVNNNIQVLFAWIILYLAFLSTGESYSRYFIILIPFLYVITLYGIIELSKSMIIKSKIEKIMKL